MERAKLTEKKIAGNENTGLLKWIALIFMVIDHVGVVFFPGRIEWRFFGRIAFPLYAWCLVVGACRTRCMWRYALRLALMGLVTQPCYMFGFHVPWNDLNILFTLLLGLLALWGIRERRYYSHVWAPVLCLTLPLLIDIDYGWRGVAVVLFLYAARGSRASIAAVMTAFCCFWGEGTLVIRNMFGITIPAYLPFLPKGDLLMRTITRVQFYGVLALPFILWKDERRTPMPKALGYLVYPAHILMIGIIRICIGI